MRDAPFSQRSSYLKQIKRITLGGRRWSVEWKEKVRDPDCPKVPFVGLCWHDKRKLEVSTEQSPQEVSETFVHEMLHAVFPFLSEEAVMRSAKELNDALWAAKLNTTEQ